MHCTCFHLIVCAVTGFNCVADFTPFTRYNWFDNWLYRVNKHPTGCQNVLTTGWMFVYSHCLFNRFDNRVEWTAIIRSTSCQTGLYNRFDNRLYTRYSRLWNRFDNRLYRVYKHLTSCQTCWQPVERTYCVNGAFVLWGCKNMVWPCRGWRS